MESEERFTISKALAIAEECVADAKRARETGEPDGGERFQEWSTTLFALRTMQERDVPERLRDSKAERQDGALGNCACLSASYVIR